MWTLMWWSLFLFRRKCRSIQMAELTVVSIVMVLATTFMHSTVGKPTVRSINWPLYKQTFVLMISWVLSRFTLCAETFKKMQETSSIACVLKLPRSQIAEALIPIEILISAFTRQKWLQANNLCSGGKSYCEDPKDYPLETILQVNAVTISSLSFHSE